ncbi:MAG: DMT family transporter [Pseudomonadota bacterium]
MTDTTTPQKPGAAALRGIGYSLLGFAVFSAHDVIVKLLGENYSIFQILFFSVLAGFIPMTLAMSMDNKLDNFRPHKPWLVTLRALLNVCGMAAAFYAFTVLPLTQVYALIFATPLLITVLAVPILGETIRLRRGLAVAIGFIGVLIVLRPGSADLTLGHAAAISVAIFGSAGALIVRKLGRGERTAVIVLYPLYAMVVIMGVLQPWVYQPLPLRDLAAMGVVGLMALAGQFLIVMSYRVAPAAVVAPMQYTQILWATLYGFVLFEELPDRWTIIGAAVIILSGIYIVLRETKPDVSEVSPILRTPNLRPDTGVSPRPKLFQRMRPRALKERALKERRKTERRKADA